MARARRWRLLAARALSPSEVRRPGGAGYGWDAWDWPGIVGPGKGLGKRAGTRLSPARTAPMNAALHPPSTGQMTVTSFMEGGVRNAAQAGAQLPGHQVPGQAPARQAPAPLPPHQALNKENAAPVAAAGHLKRSFGEVDLT